MSGICGVIFADQHCRLCAADIAPMIQALKMSEQGEGTTSSTATIGLGAQGSLRCVAAVVDKVFHDCPYALAFYGSLYNLEELLVDKESDPGTHLLHLYQKEGMAFLHRLRGEFALAIWDGQQETLHLATDRFRVHSLLYYQDCDKLVFASRMKSLLACPLPMDRTIRPAAVVDVMESSYIPTPETIFQEVKKLPPGYVLSYRHGKVRLAPYWDINFLHAAGASERELAQHLKTAFTEAIAIRYAAARGTDRIGAFLSGGVDSSTVTGVLTQVAGKPIKSFSIGFDEARFNEIQYARIAARAFGTEHHEYFVTPQDVLQVLPLLLEGFDEPYGNASAVPTYFCAKLARDYGVEVLYAGDGGDEFFAGNERYAVQRLFDYYHCIPTWLRQSCVEPGVLALAQRWNWTLLRKGQKYIQRARTPYPERLCAYGVFEVIPMADLLADHILETLGGSYHLHAPVYYHYSQAQAQSELDRQLYVDLKLAIADNDLLKVTRMTEAAGVCVHFPFLDHRLAEFAATVPAQIKMRGRKLRSFFKNAYADMLPREILTKHKHGFGLPIPVWLRTDKALNDMMHDLVLGPQTIQRGFFRKHILEQLVENHKTDETSFYGTMLWNVMMLEAWLRQQAI